MEQINNVIGNPTTLIIERLFWLALGGFLGVAIITSLVRGLNDDSGEKAASQKN
tara:strand:+ start:328 stop:489 length:162 start_codon:yes stop_codon:yes gene_type:complete